MALYLARTATYCHKNSHVHYTRRALSNHINFVSIREILPRTVAKYTCLKKPLKWLTIGKRLKALVRNVEVYCLFMVILMGAFPAAIHITSNVHCELPCSLPCNICVLSVNVVRLLSNKGPTPLEVGPPLLEIQICSKMAPRSRII